MRSIHHTGSTVSSFERSLDFCVGILGMDVAVALAPLQHGPQLDGTFDWTERSCARRCCAPAD
jgi:catechol 2,3-dioxygenase-like lactoylglutathione lyase family enzyme